MSPASDNPRALLGAARMLTSSKPTGFGAAWSRPAAHLCRQALELAIDQFWQARAPAMQAVPMRAQLICLPSYLRDRRIAGRASFAWAALSNACHHHAYDLSPNASELLHWIETVEALLAALHESAGVGE